MSQQYTALWSPGLYALGGLHGPFCCGRMTTVVGLIGMVVSGPFGCQALPCLEAAIC